jgi:hypothetical protein
MVTERGMGASTTSEGGELKGQGKGILAVDVVLVHEVGGSFSGAEGAAEVLVEVEEVVAPDLYEGAAVLLAVSRIYRPDHWLPDKSISYIWIVSVVDAVDRVREIPDQANGEGDDFGSLCWPVVVALQADVVLER